MEYPLYLILNIIDFVCYSPCSILNILYTEKTVLPFPFTNGIPFGSKSKGKLSPRSYPIQCERKWKHSFLSVPDWLHPLYYCFLIRGLTQPISSQYQKYLDFLEEHGGKYQPNACWLFWKVFRIGWPLPEGAKKSRKSTRMILRGQGRFRRNIRMYI